MQANERSRATFKEVHPQALEETIITHSPQEWFAWLQQRGCKKFQIYHDAEEAKNFGDVYYTDNGRGWYIETVFDETSSFWKEPQYWKNVWTHTKDAKGRGYTEFSELSIIHDHSKSQIVNVEIELEKAIEQLQKALTDILEFATKHLRPGWDEVFQNILEQLEDKPFTSARLNSDCSFLIEGWVIENNYDDLHLRLLKVVARLFIFTGWNSWNELDERWDWSDVTGDLYKQVSEDLYKARNLLLVNTINKDKFTR